MMNTTWVGTSKYCCSFPVSMPSIMALIHSMAHGPIHVSICQNECHSHCCAFFFTYDIRLMPGLTDVATIPGFIVFKATVSPVSLSMATYTFEVDPSCIRSFATNR